MINFFRALNPLNILWLAVMLFVLRVCYLFTGPAQLPFAFAEPFAKLLIPQKTFIISPSYNLLFAGIIVFSQAILLNSLVNRFNLLGKPTFLPALMYITISSLFTPFLVLSPPLLCNYFMIWMLFKLLSFYKSDDAKSAAYDLGMIVATGSILYLPFIYLLLGIWIALFLFRPFNWRELVAAIIGYVTIFFFLGVYYYLNESLGQFFKIWSPLATRFPNSVHINYYNYLILIPVILIMVLAIIKLQQNFFKSYVQVRKSFQLLFLIFVIAGLCFYVNEAFHLNHFLLCTMPLAVFFAYYFLYAKARWFYESLYFILLAGIIYFQFNTF